uniref:Uncharacterized protein n=1 Tax=Parascaris univalens TaxID=6257 RepID=A0A915AIL9_PARUN
MERTQNRCPANITVSISPNMFGVPKKTQTPAPSLYALKRISSVGFSSLDYQQRTFFNIKSSDEVIPFPSFEHFQHLILNTNNTRRVSEISIRAMWGNGQLQHQSGNPNHILLPFHKIQRPVKSAVNKNMKQTMRFNERKIRICQPTTNSSII